IANPFTFYQTYSFAGFVNNNQAGSMTAGTEVDAAPPDTSLASGDTATIGFWHNKNGQAVINSFNGGSSSTALANWLSSNFGNLSGNLAGQTNQQIAAAYLTAFGNVGGVQGNTYAQTFALALAIYATDPTLGANATSMSKGFNSEPGGTGAKTFNVG